MKLNKFLTQHRLIGSTFTVSSGTLLSRVFGFLRDMIIAAKLGSSPINDAFITAFRLANILRNIFAEGALSVVFVPEFTKILTQQGKKEAFLLASKVHLLLIVLLSFITLMGIVFMQDIIWYTAPGFREKPEIMEITILFARITFPYLFCISLAAFYGGILNCFNKFLPFALAPTILNITTIIAVIFFDIMSSTGHTLSIATTIGGIIELIWMVYFLLKYRCQLSVQIKFLNPQTKKMMKKMVPVIFSAGIIHLNIWISIIILSFFEGGITYIYYAERIVQLPLALIGTAIGTVLLPKLSKSLYHGSIDKTIAMQNKAISLALFLAIPASLGLYYLANDIIFLLFERGNFNDIDSKKTAEVLSILSFGLPAFVMVKVFQTKFYANLNTKLPVIISALCMILNVIISVIMMKKMEYKGVALANSISGWVNFLLLLLFAYKKISFKLCSDTILQIARTLFSAVVMIAAIFIWQQQTMQGEHQKIMIICEIIIGVITYFLISYILKNRFSDKL